MTQKLLKSQFWFRIVRITFTLPFLDICYLPLLKKSDTQQRRLTISNGRETLYNVTVLNVMGP